VKKRYFLLGFVVILSAIYFLSLDSFSGAEVSHKETLGIPVEVGKVTTGSIKDANNYVGTLKNKNQIHLASKQSGFISRLKVEEGGAFKKGDILLELDAEELLIKKELALQKMKNAELNLEHIKDLLDKNRILYEAGAITKQQIEDLTLKYEMAQNNIKEAAINIKEIDLMLYRSSIYAPYDGVVREVLKKEGEFIQPGQPILQVSEKDDLIIEIAVIEKDLKEIEVGSNALIYFENFKVIKSQVSEIANILNPQTKTANIEIPVPSQSALLPNMTVKVSIIKEEKENVILIPSNSVLSQGQKQYVYCYENGTAQQKKVEIGISDGSMVEIIGGLKLSDKLIVSNLQELTNNSKVFVYKGVE